MSWRDVMNMHSVAKKPRPERGASTAETPSRSRAGINDADYGFCNGVQVVIVRRAACLVKRNGLAKGPEFVRLVFTFVIALWAAQGACRCRHQAHRLRH